ncbi:hypothetical protein ACFWP5_08910 [Streptomyces sp. NPDC058469]|uniref:hypothetical protein n=1 Tax=Streptomyces sp. NPDC058469 TaxID=3346514 RepID=UPI00365BF276
MKAYLLSVKDEDDAGQAVVFANTAKEAKKQVFAHDSLVEALEGGWIDLRVHRSKRYDGMEKLSAAELALHQWPDGWQWFDMDFPYPDESTDAEFIEWYNDTFPTPTKKENSHE